MWRKFYYRHTEGLDHASLWKEIILASFDKGHKVYLLNYFKGIWLTQLSEQTLRTFNRTISNLDTHQIKL